MTYSRFDPGCCCTGTGTDGTGPVCDEGVLPSTLYAYFYDSWLIGVVADATVLSQAFELTYDPDLTPTPGYRITGESGGSGTEGIGDLVLISFSSPCDEQLTATIGIDNWDQEPASETGVRRFSPYFSAFLSDDFTTPLNTAETPPVITIREEAYGAGEPVPGLFDCSNTLPTDLIVTLTLKLGYTLAVDCTAISGTHTLTYLNDGWYKEFDCGTKRVRLSLGFGRGIIGVGPNIAAYAFVGIFCRYTNIFGETIAGGLWTRLLQGGVTVNPPDDCSPFLLASTDWTGGPKFLGNCTQNIPDLGLVADFDITVTE